MKMLILGTIVTVMVVGWLYRQAHNESFLTPEEVVGGALPGGVREAQAFKSAYNSKYLQVFFPEHNAKLSLLVTSAPTNNTDSGVAVPFYEAVRLYKTSKVVSAGYARSVLVFLASQGDVRRGRDVSIISFPSLAHLQINGATFVGKEDDRHLIGATVLPAGSQVGFAFFTKNDVIPVDLAQKLLLELPLFQAKDNVANPQ